MDIDLSFLTPITAKDKSFLARQLSTMIASGLALNKAMGILVTQEKNTKLKKVLQAVQTDIEEGASFSAAAAKHPDVFDSVFVNIVVSGETVGRLSEVLDHLADQMEQQASFTSKVRGAFAYPAFIFVAMIIVGAIMMVYIVPQLKQIFDEANATLPWSTQVIIALSIFLQNYWWAAIIGLIVTVVLGRVYLKSRAGQRLFDSLKLKLPGGLGVEIAMARLTGTLAMLIQAGTPIIEALNVTADVVDNILYRELLTNAVEQVKRGVPLSVPIASSPLFPTIVAQMTAVGEQTGQLDKILANLAAYYEGEVDQKLKDISSLLEPIIIVIIGVGVGFLVYSILVPIYSIAQLQ